MDKRKLLVLFWLGAMLVPLNLLQTYTGDLQFVLLRLLSSELAHVVGHLFLFSMLVVIVLSVFQPPLNWRTAFLVTGMIVAVGLGQEFMQLIAKGRGFGGPEVFDLGVDLAGG
ncbi:MAG: VanZ family protein, partial [Anaerolineales bacterium]